ncbi:MAG: dephospho-CoA kinase [Armatimonadetes bacterium]|nr:dephospho-CoA kinase [Armatimonadota bacterium]MDW8121519.1 dephospho-CoA kinase [Armatimonadota bacterium]
MKIPTVGIIGPAGSGKTTLSNHLRRQGQKVIIADEVNRQVLVKSHFTLRALVDCFGRSIVDNSGQLHRKKIRNWLFGSPVAFKRWNQLVHPPMRDQILRQIRIMNSRYRQPVYVEAAVLREMGLLTMVDQVWCVWSSPTKRLARLRRAGWTLPSLMRIVRWQEPSQRFIAMADRVIVNEMDLPDFFVKAGQAHNKGEGR